MVIQRTRKGFTLVELLVVIAIIGLLVGLLVPAINAARELARKAQCVNNMKQVATAAIMHDTEKQYFPGRLNFTLANNGVEIPVSWMAKLLPYMDSQNVWDAMVDPTQAVPMANWNTVITGISNPSALPAGSRPWYVTELPVATCPSDPQVSLIGARLSYVINSGIFDRAIDPTNMNRWLVSDDGTVGERRANGVAHVIPYSGGSGKVTQADISKGDGLSSTVLISENVNAVSWPLFEEGSVCMVWTSQTEWLPETSDLTLGRQYGINKGRERYLDDQLLTMSQSSPEQLVSLARPSSNHSKGVNVAFCDGHVEMLADDIQPWVYARRLSTNKKLAREPGVGGGWPGSLVPVQTNSYGDDSNNY
ncbi:MAG: DUF1559 domain-containing protein [Planctomycetales bacterium]|nr:DUF1559 domain-containing protein [Planctomycetales bacterium]MCA9168187.1 DUF1559 domain-containing protein [Planctomycetales bacterium]